MAFQEPFLIKTQLLVKRFNLLLGNLFVLGKIMIRILSIILAVFLFSPISGKIREYDNAR